MIFQVPVHGGVISWESHGDIIDLLGPHLVNGFYPQLYMDVPLLYIYVCIYIYVYIYMGYWDETWVIYIWIYEYIYII